MPGTTYVHVRVRTFVEMLTWNGPLPVVLLPPEVHTYRPDTRPSEGREGQAGQVPGQGQQLAAHRLLSSVYPCMTVDEHRLYGQRSLFSSLIPHFLRLQVVSIAHRSVLLYMYMPNTQDEDVSAWERADTYTSIVRSRLAVSCMRRSQVSNRHSARACQEQDAKCVRL